MFYAQLQIIPLNTQEHEGNGTARELIGGLFDKLITLLAVLVHSCGTEISIVRAS